MTTRLSSPVEQETTSAPIVASSRSVLLAEASRNLGRDWANEWFEDLRQQGRAIAGGWPGTMSEARSRVRFSVDAILSQRSMAAMSQAELAEAAQITYESARTLWFDFRVRDEGIA